MKEVNGNAFCKQNGLPFSSLIHCLSIPYHNRILGRDKPEFNSEMFVVFITVMVLDFCGLEFILWVVKVVIENGKNALKSCP